MKVIKKGREQKGWAGEYECSGAGNKGGGCGAILLVEQGDLFRTTRSCMGRDLDYFVTFRCPECKSLTDIKDSPFYAEGLPLEKDLIKANSLQPRET